MILNAVIHGEWRYAETWAEMSGLINEVMETLEAEHDSPYLSPGDDARLMFSDRRHSGTLDLPNNYLQVAVNSSTGYGGLIWYVTKGFTEEGGIFDRVWISDNPDPPDFDPRVVSDPGEPRFHNPRSTLPIAMVRAAVEEFCLTGTGVRPECISWIPGEASGRRLDDDS